MAVQKSRKSRARRGTRCAHDAITGATLSTDSTTGEIHRRHHISAEGIYRGRQVLTPPEETPEDEEE